MRKGMAWLGVLLMGAVGAVCANDNADDATALHMEIIAPYVPMPEVVGTARLSVWIWDVYDATLYAPNGMWAADQPYALALRYLRALDGAAIAERSVEEMRKQGFSNERMLTDWQAQMTAIFPDVDATTTLIGVRNAAGATFFYQNGEQLGVIADSLFSDWFFAIWLGAATSQPAMRAELLGLQ